MGNFVRGLIGKSLLFVLLVGVALTGYVVFIEFPMNPTFWKVAASTFTLTVALICALLSSLTLTTRYVIVGVLGLASSVLYMVNALYATWENKSSELMAGLPTSPSQVMSDYMGSGTGEDNGIGSAVMIIVMLVAVALPIINVVLYFSYQSNPVGEILGITTAVAIMALIIIAGVSTATSDGSEMTGKWMIFLSFLSTAGFIGTLAASSFDSERYSGGSIHYDIQSDELPSALPQSFQQPTPARPRPVVNEDPQLPELELPTSERT